jgi:anti-sigma regulatory factor (Ser/Thr protein kinase)
VARGAALDEIALDEVRLAVGEAATRAVQAHLRAGNTALVEFEFTITPSAFVVSVTDRASRAPRGGGDPLALLTSDEGGLDDPTVDANEVSAALELAMVQRVAGSVGVAELKDGGTTLTMAWKLPGIAL